MNTLTLLFLTALATGLLMQLWLYRRHDTHVQAHRGRVPEAFADRVDLAQHQKAADYTHAKIRLAMFEELVGTALLLIWTLGGGLSLVLGAWDGSALSPILAGAAAMLTVLFVQGALDLPLELWRTFRLEQRFGFNRTTAAQYLKDKLLGIAVGLALGAPLLLAILWLMEQAGNLWWLHAWLLWMAFTLFITWLYPTLIAPLFNKFEPLSEGALKERIQGLIERCGFTNRGIYVMDGSRRSAHGNAYFTGFGRSKRIVFFDTLVDSLAVDELEAVLAHELGHFKRRHVMKNLLLSAGLTLFGFWLLGWLMQQPWFYAGLGVSAQSSAAALLLFLFAAPTFTQFLTPLGSWLMRRHEFEADDYAVDHTGGQSLVRALVKLYQENASTLTPDPLFSAFHDSHPPAPVRIAHISSRIAQP
jgi:STE24 endopeptidase